MALTTLKFYKTASRPANAAGSLWFDTNTNRIKLLGSDANSDKIFGSSLKDATYKNSKLEITKIDGSKVEVDLSKFVTASDIANKLEASNLEGSGGTTVTANGNTVTISSPTTWDASAITSGTIDIARIPKAALERLYIVTTEAEALSNTEISEGDTVQVTNNSNKMYFCVNDEATTFTGKFREYTAATTISVDWDDIGNKPTKLSQFTDDLTHVKTAALTITSTSNVSKADPYINLVVNGSVASSVQLYAKNGTPIKIDSNGRITFDYLTSDDLTNYITSSDLTNYATQSWVEEKNYITSSDLEGYATQQWVEDQGYLTSVDLSGYALSSSISDNTITLKDGNKTLGSFTLNGEAKPIDLKLSDTFATKDFAYNGISGLSINVAKSSTATEDFTTSDFNNPIINYRYSKIDGTSGAARSLQLMGDSGITVTKVANSNQIKISGPDLSSYLTSAPVTSVNGKTGDVTITVPTKTSQLTNDSGFITSVPKVTVDSSITSTSSNPVTSSAIYDALQDKADSNHTHDSRYYTEEEIDTKLKGYVTSVNGSSGAVTLTIPDTSSLLDEVGLVAGLDAASFSNTLYKKDPYINVWSSTAAEDIEKPVSGSIQLVGSGSVSVIAQNGVITISGSSSSYTLPTASPTTLGGIKVGTNLSIKSGVLSATNTTYSNATTSTAGLMSASDKAKLDGLSNYTLPTATSTTLGGVKVDDSISSSSTNPVQNKAISTALNGKADTNHNHTLAELGLKSEVWTFDLENGSSEQKTVIVING